MESEVVFLVAFFVDSYKKTSSQQQLCEIAGPLPECTALSLVLGRRNFTGSCHPKPRSRCDDGHGEAKLLVVKSSPRNGQSKQKKRQLFYFSFDVRTWIWWSFYIVVGRNRTIWMTVWYGDLPSEPHVGSIKLCQMRTWEPNSGVSKIGTNNCF